MRLSALILILTLMLSASSAVSQHLARLGPLLERHYPTMLPTTEVKVWVHFTDKGPEAEQRLSQAPEEFLSERSVQRRRNARDQQSVLDLEDLPLHRPYVETASGVVKQIRHEAKWFNAVSVVATKEQIEILRRLPFVREIDLVATFRRAREEQGERAPSFDPPPPTDSPTLLNYGNSFTQNNQINAVAVHNLGINGSGVLIGIFDAGFSNLTHPALVTRPIVARYDFVTNSTTLGNHSHGQNTFSVVGGFADGFLIGPAYGSSFVLARTEDATPETPIEEDHWVRAIIWADSIGIDVASTSLSYLDYDAPWPSWTWQNMDGRTAVITRAADRAAELGIVVVNSAGNAGSDPSRNTLGAPADGFHVITVGAVNSSGTRSSFSSVGPTVDNRIKPDVMAMGSGVTGASGATGYTNFLSGTSFSCPLTAGVAALVVSANPGLTAFQVNEALRQTSNRANNPDRFYGWGILDALKAVNYAWITHAPLAHTEDTTGRSILVKIRSRVPLVMDSTRVVYGVNGTFTGSALLTPAGPPDEYTAQIPYLGSGVNITYYIATRNANVSVRLPLNAPTQFFSYQVGQDLTGPTISHLSLGNQSIHSWPPRISATVSDASGVNSVMVEYFLNGIAQTPFALPLVNGVYTDTLHLNRSQISSGDSIFYRIIARDNASLQNQSTFPASGFVRFAVRNFVNLSLDFEGANMGFTATNDWQWGARGGASPQPYSGVNYWGTNLTGNYAQGPRLSSLTSPTWQVFSNSASFSFWHWFEMQSRYDGGNVKVSLNGGPFQVVQPREAYSESSLYSGFGNPLGSQPGYSSVGGTSWNKATFDLAGIAVEGNTIAVRLDFGADNSIQYRGWYVDDFVTDGFGLVGPVSVDEETETPLAFALDQNYPNPFNPATSIRFSLPEPAHVTLKVYDLLGREVAALVQDQLSAAVHSIRWDGRDHRGTDVASGVYLYRLTAAGESGIQSMSRKLMILK